MAAPPGRQVSRAGEPAARSLDPDAGRVDGGPHGPPLVEPRVAAADRLRRGVGVLGEVVAAAGVEHEVVEGVQQRRQAAASPSARRRSASSPGAGKLSGAGLAAPNRLSTLRKLGAPDAAKRSSTRRSASSAPNGHSNWYCRNPARPYSRFHDPTMSSGWKKPGIDSTWPIRRRGALRYHSSLNALIVVWLMTPGPGHDRRHVDPLARVVGERVDGLLRRELVDGGVVAAGEHAAPEVPALAIGSIHATE